MAEDKIYERGTVKSFNEAKGYGFIVPDVDTQRKDIYFHKTSIEDLVESLDAGERVEYEIHTTPKGPEAKHVRPLKI